jgi:uncharacterized protein YbbC (DUF1343 family)
LISKIFKSIPLPLCVFAPLRLITFVLLFLTTWVPAEASQKVTLGIDRLMQEEYSSLLKGKKIGLITNHTGINSEFKSTTDVLKSHAAAKGYKLTALFAPEHGINGAAFAAVSVDSTKDADGIPIFSLYGKTERPTDEMLKDVNLLIFDIQDIGTRSYTYITTMFFAMEEAAKRKIPFVVLDRPNPINGLTIDGPMLEEKWRSPLGYINIPYCHGMTVGELAKYFNGEYRIGCKLEVIPMKGWKRSMSFKDTGLPWIPTRPYIPEAETVFFYPTTGILGELRIINSGIGYTLPFKLVGAPWIDAKRFAQRLNSQKFPGVHFEPFYYTPVYGRYAKENCQGVLIVITDHKRFKPVSTQYLLIGMLKGLYPDQFQEAIAAAKKRKETLCKLNGTEEAYRLIVEEKNIVWKLCGLHKNEQEAFATKRTQYLITDYDVLKKETSVSKKSST